MKIDSFKTRFYNNIEVSDGKVYKTGPIERILLEKEWLSALSASNSDIAPITFKSNQPNQLVMQHVQDGSLLTNILNERFEPALLLKDLHELCNKLHAPKPASRSQITNDINEMYLEKPLRSLEYFSQNLKQSDRSLKVEVRKTKDLLKEWFKNLRNDLYSIDCYFFIHGDLTSGNILVDEGGFKLIDPRAKFGGTKFFGDKRYDYAKIYYSLFGSFDLFNNGNFEDENAIRIPKLINSNFEELFFRTFDLDKKNNTYIQSTIWLSLMPHFEDSYRQMKASYLFGQELLQSLNE